ncbi:lipopolysaccharide biosynthesis protein [Chloroflexota bacterium]
MLQLTKLLSLRIIEFLTEVFGIVTSRERLKQLWHVRLYSNAVYMVIANATSALFGFVFWIIAARLYPPEDVGLAAALIAAVSLLMWFCDLGLGWGLIRFLSHSGKNAEAMINTVLITRILLPIVVAFIFVAGLGFWSPALLFIRDDPTYLTAFVLFTVAYALFISVNDTFIAKRRAGFTLANTFVSTPPKTYPAHYVGSIFRLLQYLCLLGHFLLCSRASGSLSVPTSSPTSLSPSLHH